MANRKLVDNPGGLPIVDASEDLVFEITASDVRKGQPKVPSKCAARHGVCRLDGVVDAYINKSVSYIVYGDKIVRFTTPDSIVRELISFDRGGTFAPGEYYLKRPGKTARLDRVPHRSKKDGTRKKIGARATRHVTVMVRGA